MLGCISFGGPAAHIGYFRKVFVEKLGWLEDESYARLISLSQFLPGPGSSQIGFAIGLRRAGLLGGIAAFIGFTLPSFLLLYFLAVFTLEKGSADILSGIVHGLKLLALVVVADATLSMFKSFCKEKATISIALISAVALLAFPSLLTQLSVLLIAGSVGAFYTKRDILKDNTKESFKVLPLLLFFILLFGLPLLAFFFPSIKIFSDFYQAGSLVFGGGHVVLPLLQEILGDTVSTDRFLLGYASAQAVPGPMFALASFLGVEISQENLLTGALLATAGVFLPGFLLVLSLQGAWESLASRPKIAGASWGINAAVVGLLISVLYQPVFLSAIGSPLDMSLAILGFFVLRVIKIPIVFLVLGFGIIGFFLS